MSMESQGSLSKEFPFDQVLDTIALVHGGMADEDLRAAASAHTHQDIPAILRNRFLLIERNRVVQDHFLIMFAAEGRTSARVRKTMYLLWALRDSRLRSYILDKISDSNGRWQPEQITNKSNASFFESYLSPSTTTKVRSNIEYFLVEAGIFDPSDDSVHLELTDGWVPDAIRIAAQHETDTSLRRYMTTDPVGYLITHHLNGLVNATPEELKGSVVTVDPETDVVDDGEIESTSTSANKTWARTAPTYSDQIAAVANLNQVARERAGTAHYNLERLMAEAVKGVQATPMFNSNIDILFDRTDWSVIAEMKSCHRNNLHAQIRRGVSQLLEYRHRYKSKLKPNIALVLVIELRPSVQQRWLVDYLQEVGILLAWKSATGDRLESSIVIPACLQGIIAKV